jgi:hypothetical protein
MRAGRLRVPVHWVALPNGINHAIGNHAMPETPFLTDIQTLRKRPRAHR